MPLQTQQIPEETATAPVSLSSARLSDTAETVYAVTNSTVAELLEAAENEEQKRRTVFRVYDALCCVIAIAYIGTTFALLARGSGLISSNLQVSLLIGWFAASILNFACFMARQWAARYNRAVYEAAARLLPAANEPRRLLPLMDSLRAHKTPAERRQIYPALTELLWNLPAADAALLLDEPRRDALRTALTGSYTMMANFKRQASDGHFDDATADLAVAIMKTLAGIGDKKSVKALQKIIGADAKTPNDTVVRDTAREYLPVLTQKIAENEAIQKQFRRAVSEKIRDPQKILGLHLDTLPVENAKSALVEYLRPNRRGFAYWYCAFMIVVSPVFLIPFYLDSRQPFLIFIMALLVVTGLLFPRWGIESFAKEDGRFALELARRSETDTRLLPILIQAAGDYPEKQQGDAIQKAIARLLPLLQPGDAALVPPAQRAYLRSWLKLPRRKNKKGGKGNTSQTLAILALNALATIGDIKALPAAEAIARRTTRGNYHEADLHAAALRCVDALRMRKG